MENTDVVLLQERKTLAPKFNVLEVDNLARETTLNERWQKEEEERKRRQEEEEENKFDFSSFLLESKKPVTKKGTKQGLKGRSGGGTSSNTNKNGGLASRQLKTQNSNIDNGVGGTKRKANMTKRNSSALPSVGEIAEVSTKRDQVSRKNSVMLPNAPGAMIDGSSGVGK